VSIVLYLIIELTNSLTVLTTLGSEISPLAYLARRSRVVIPAG
jgi:hypothetical protein